DQAMQRRDDLAKRGGQTLPGIGDQAERALITRTAMTGDAAGTQRAVMDEIKEALIAHGVDPNAAAEQAEAATSQAGEKARDKIRNEAMNPEQEERAKPKKLESFDASDLANRIQNSVGQEDQQKQQTDLLKDATKYLAQMANQQGYNLRIAK